MQIFELSDIAQFVGMPAFRVKKWTLEPRIGIRPSVRESKGTGSSNLYSRKDLYFFALANELWISGLTIKAVGRVLGKLRKGRDVFGATDVWGLRLRIRAPKTTEIDLLLKTQKSLPLQDENWQEPSHVVPIASLKSRVDLEIKKGNKRSK